MNIFLVGYPGLKGTSILACKKKEELLAHFSNHFVENSINLYNNFKSENIDLPDELINVSPSQGGILAALWELGEILNRGMEISLESVPVRQETIEITEFFDINPYRLYSDGCVLFAESQEVLSKSILQKGYICKKIGYTTRLKDRCVLYDENRMFLTAKNNDEINKVLGKDILWNI